MPHRVVVGNCGGHGHESPLALPSSYHAGIGVT
jgi:hypothetical protein